MKKHKAETRRQHQSLSLCNLNKLKQPIGIAFLFTEGEIN